MLTELKIGDFLLRKKIPVKILPDEEYSLVTVKLYHKGVILREKKEGSLLGSNMYRVSAGDFILSGIDARNGAFGIVPEDLDGAIVTNDFWYFDVDESKVKRDFFYWLTTTPLFLDACQKSSKGETQRIRLQKNLFYEFVFYFPPVEEQDSFLQSFGSIDKSLSTLKNETATQSAYLNKLRQAILQEAIEGKLTADWRKENHVRKGDPDYDAEALLEKIKAEKEKLIKEGKIKKQKQLAPIKADEVPFELPEGWVWTRLGEVCSGTEAGKSPNCKKEPAKPDQWGVIRTTAIQALSFLQGENKVLPNGYSINSNQIVKNNELLITRAGPINRVGVVCLTKNVTQNLILSDKTIRINYLKGNVDPSYVAISLNSNKIGNLIESMMTGMADSQVNITQENIKLISLPLPPLSEQNAIVERVEKLLSVVDELDKQVSVRKEQSEQLMQAVLRDAFEGGNCD